ncbi:hypothetical protein EXE43_18925 [Halorubrum sp. SS5]|uniref:Uncharacterized protein n=1 Tax=Halorubrum kocurii JCM 14978 TaxID=1230456 RepID=M0PLG6_9EURY|nr:MULTISPECIES: hypothetical protein [Halorubrum]EMA69570.1 hypothetical protein C468_01175 [Halorubrum kocurii JCM 14978]TKX57269.1 hypothetical protein EXE44_10910 [Halorubrum sp. SS7]TKX84434.1 hypothetical protein EXE43_18925 [Halorubrum sp. SS5]
MSGNKLLIAAGATVIWVISGVLLFEVASLASAFELAVSGPILDLTSLLDAWLLAGVILGIVDVALLWDMATGW